MTISAALELESIREVRIARYDYRHLAAANLRDHFHRFFEKRPKVSARPTGPRLPDIFDHPRGIMPTEGRAEMLVPLGRNDSSVHIFEYTARAEPEIIAEHEREG